MQRSNTYVITFTAIMTIVIGGLLSLTNQVLKPAQTRSVELDTKQQILMAVMDLKKKDDVLAMYDSRIQGLVVDYNGNEIIQDEKGNPIRADQVNVLRNFKKPMQERQYPVYKFINTDNGGTVEGYIFPVYGNGLWNNIFGYIALESDLNTIKGTSFGHFQETPGLGARIADKDVQNRYVGKTIFDENGNLISVTMKKGELGDPSAFGEHEIDGMSGATLTAKGLNAMLLHYLQAYEAYIKKIASQETI